MHYYKRNIGDYHKKAGRLSMLEHGAYTLLIDSCYDRERFPSEEEAIDWCWARSDEEINAVKFVLSRFFTLVDGLYVQDRISEEIASYKDRALKNKEIAENRERERREKRERIEHDSCTDRHLTINQEPLTINQEPEDQKPCDQQAESQAPVRIPYDEILDAFKSRLPSFPQPRRPLDDDRKRAVRSLWTKKEQYGSVDFFDRYFNHVSESEFLSGWKGCGFDWLMKPANFRKVIEGNYHGEARHA